jgi:hypothetical protein
MTGIIRGFSFGIILQPTGFHAAKAGTKVPSPRGKICPDDDDISG